MQEDYNKKKYFSDIKAKEALGYIGGLADFAGNFLIKPGPTLGAGLALKSLGTIAGLAQNVVEERTIAELFGTISQPPVPVIPSSVFPATPDRVFYGADGVTPLGVPQCSLSGSTQVDVIWVKLSNGGYQKMETVTTYQSGNWVLSSATAWYQYNSDGNAVQGTTVTRDAQGNTTSIGALRPSTDGQARVSAPMTYAPPADLGSPGRNSALYINALGAQTMQFMQGGGVDDL